jgi:hypothetical protein
MKQRGLFVKIAAVVCSFLLGYIAYFAGAFDSPAMLPGSKSPKFTVQRVPGSDAPKPK